ncbi:cellulose binding domain-containing protein [Paractinoplanes lichenicola]|uniref:Cellulose binding domain-containing protein n=1 Tax=Paractinoplanes lichenicola TaxID=2802976 RepID=A0ABS1W5V1_9ACTN|nr:cellulose binding domain-containing protein [Actinoplanes lichenicola]MBL7262097.1 cellulose binding domain-containing protein [Actinoplanes lichenicola]
MNRIPAVIATLVTAGAAAVNGWSVGLTLPAGTTVSNSWNVNRTGTAFSNVAYNGQIPAGGYVEFGFQATGSPGSLTPTCTTA